MQKLPLYEMSIKDETESEVEVSAIALVDSPAIEKAFYAFDENTNPLAFSQIKEDEYLIVGPAMIPDMKIYRNDPDFGEYQVFFSKETVVKIAEKFYKKAFQSNVNLMHNSEQMVEGVTYFLSFIRDSAKGMVGLAGDYPEGTWFVGARVQNPAVWEKIKSGEITGFSVEGVFEYYKPNKEETAPVDTDDELLAKIKELLNGK